MYAHGALGQGFFDDEAAADDLDILQEFFYGSFTKAAYFGIGFGAVFLITGEGAGEKTLIFLWLYVLIELIQLGYLCGIVERQNDIAIPLELLLVQIATKDFFHFWESKHTAQQS
jgi:hypothetical protein